jgi:hypothetical protein
MAFAPSKAAKEALQEAAAILQGLLGGVSASSARTEHKS